MELSRGRRVAERISPFRAKARFTPDATIRGGPAIQVSVERAGAGNGRVNMIAFTASNGKPGEVSIGTVTVGVPHDQRNRGDTCAGNDDGQKYDATK